MSKATEKLKMTRIYVSSRGNAGILDKLATLFGFRWAGGQKPKDYPITSDSYLYIDSNCRMCNASETYSQAFKTVYGVDWAMCEMEHRRERTEKKRAQRAKKSPWIPNTGVCPVALGELIDVKYADGHIRYAAKALDPTGVAGEYVATSFRTYGSGRDITHYRIVKPQPPKVRKTKPDNKVSVGQMIDAFNQGKPADVVVGPDTNPKKQFGDKSIPLNLWPALASAYGALGLYNGKLKYGANNFKATPVEASVYISAAKRHLEAWAEGEEFDPADGVPNLAGVLANIAILLEARAQGTLIDDRNLGTGYLKERDKLKEIVASLQVLHADKNPKHYYKTEV